MTLHALCRSPRRFYLRPCPLGDDTIRRLERRNLAHARTSALKARVRRLGFAQAQALRAEYGVRDTGGGVCDLHGQAVTAPGWFQGGHWSYRVLLGLAWAWCLVAYLTMLVLLGRLAMGRG